MSTRCQVQVIQKGLGWDQKITLYHHTDGYPESIIPLIRFAFKEAKQHSWRAGRAGQVASYLCWSDPGVFEPEDSHELHMDIEYFYQLEVENKNGGSIEETPNWKIKIYEPGNNFYETSNPSLEHMKLTQTLKTPMNKFKGEKTLAV